MFRCFCIHQFIGCTIVVVVGVCSWDSVSCVVVEKQSDVCRVDYNQNQQQFTSISESNYTFVVRGVWCWRALRVFSMLFFSVFCVFQEIRVSQRELWVGTYLALQPNQRERERKKLNWTNRRKFWSYIFPCSRGIVFACVGTNRIHENRPKMNEYWHTVYSIVRRNNNNNRRDSWKFFGRRVRPCLRRLRISPKNH